MQEWMKMLAGCKDVANLRPALNELFTEFGEIARMEILTMTQPGKRQALCFFQVETAAQEQQLMANFGVTRFGDQLLFILDFPTEQTNIDGQSKDSGHDQISCDNVIQRPECKLNQNTGNKRFWFNPARWSEALLVAARRMVDRDASWPNKRLAP
jgi:hypothetical protein